MSLSYRKISRLVLIGLYTLFSLEVTAITPEECDSGYAPEIYEEHNQICRSMSLRQLAQENGIDCIDCFVYQQQESNPWVEALGIIAGPLALFGSSYFGSRFAYKSQKEWAGAYRAGHEQCTSRFNSFLDYNITRGANPVLAEQAQSLMQCNGYPYSAYSGFQGYMGNGYGGFGNPFLAAGYSPGFMGGMMGPGFGAGAQFGIGLPGLGGSIGGYPSGMGYGAGMGIGMGMGMGMMGYGPGMGMGMGYGPGMGMGYGPGMGMGYGPGMNMGYGMGMGYGLPYAGLGANINLGFGTPGYGYPGAGGGAVMCFTTPCPGASGVFGYGGGNGLGGNLYFGGGVGGGAGTPGWAFGGPGMINGGAGHGSAGYYPGFNGGAHGSNGYWSPNGSYWGNTGGWAGNAFWQQQQSMQGQMYAQQQSRAQFANRIGVSNYQTGMAASQGLYNEYMRAGANYQNASAGYGSYGYGNAGYGGYFGGTPYAAGNIGLQFSLGGSAGLGF